LTSDLGEIAGKFVLLRLYRVLSTGRELALVWPGRSAEIIGKSLLFHSVAKVASKLRAPANIGAEFTDLIFIAVDKFRGDSCLCSSPCRTELKSAKALSTGQCRPFRRLNQDGFVRFFQGGCSSYRVADVHSGVQGTMSFFRQKPDIKRIKLKTCI
tara:strand:- start:90 stop:557 length:468 start_codon:yes stop_codon:yes gene_type:complete